MAGRKNTHKKLIYDNKRYVTGCLGIGVEAGTDYEEAQGNF